VNWEKEGNLNALMRAQKEQKSGRAGVQEKQTLSQKQTQYKLSSFTGVCFLDSFLNFRTIIWQQQLGTAFLSSKPHACFHTKTKTQYNLHQHLHTS
jgi:hypothetical protein